jgi:hypothetical protein
MGNAELCEAALKEITAAREKGWNVLTSDMTLTGLSEWHVPVVETVTLNPVKEDGDIYPQGQKYAVTRQGLSKLAVAAAIIWSANDTRRTDNRSSRDYVSFQAVGGLKKPDGTYAFMKAEYDLDMLVVEEELVAIHAAAAKKYNKEGRAAADYIESSVKRDLIQKRKNKLKLCESGAKDRVIRELLGIRATYTLEQIQKPFVILRIIVRPDYSDKDVKQAMLAAAVASMHGIYGAAPPAQIGYDEAIDVTAVEEVPQAQTEAEPFKDDEPKHSGIESKVIDFNNCEPSEQLKAIRKLSKAKSYDLGGYEAKAKKAVEEMKPETLEGLFRHILGLPDPQTNDQDVPFAMGG